VTKKQIHAFQKKVWDYYHANGRDFAWRKTRNPYHIVVSEIMLQQTQTSRVTTKFDEFINALPTFEALARAPQKKVLKLWQGLGYNRRALALHAIAKKVVKEHNGKLPRNQEVLKTFPGIGEGTAGSICAFAFNKPTVFIETNIRSVYLHEFFKRKSDVDDKELMPLIEETLDTNNTREWYFALMDYGVMLKKKYKNPSTKSKHHTKQSPFLASNRRIRGLLVKEFLKGTFEEKKFSETFNIKKSLIRENLETLEREKFLTKKRGKYILA
tara:strand:+ start:6664 stop:7473 length:810 start_codon:yes stop_codon:yes gene_type:complete